MPALEEREIKGNKFVNAAQHLASFIITLCFLLALLFIELLNHPSTNRQALAQIVGLWTCRAQSLSPRLWLSMPFLDIILFYQVILAQRSQDLSEKQQALRRCTMSLYGQDGF
jgi:hypothetical protein